MTSNELILSTSYEQTEPDLEEGNQYLLPPMDTDLKESKDIIWFLDRNEVGDAELFADLHGHRVAYDHADAKWYIWRKNYWEVDRTERVHNAMILVADSYKQFADSFTDSSSIVCKKLRKRIPNLLTKQRIVNVLAIASRHSRIRLTGDEWNLPPFSLPVANGVLDLSTGMLRNGTPDDYINTFAPTEWLGLDHPAPIWEKFIAEICGEHPELISFLQRLLGYAITGSTKEQVLPILRGDGSNGKSALMDTLHQVLSDAFCFSTQADSLMDTRNSNGEGPRPFVCALRNKRMVWASESQNGQRLNTGLIKQLTGDQNITARNLYSRPITFTPSHHIFLVTNSLPDLPDGNDYAMLRRLLVFPFEMRFVDNPKAPNEHRRDKDLPQKLLKESPGILAWLVRGALSWQEKGLDIPDACKIVTNKYLEDEDSIGQYVKENLRIGETFEVLASVLFSDYTQWCTNNGHTPYTSKAFGHRITRLYGETEAGWRGAKTCRVYKGIGLTS